MICAVLDLPNRRAAGSHTNDVHAFLHLCPVGDSECTAETALGNPWATARSGNTVNLIAHPCVAGVSSSLIGFSHIFATTFQSICPNFSPIIPTFNRGEVSSALAACKQWLHKEIVMGECMALIFFK